MQGLIVHQVTEETFTLAWTAEDDAFDTFVIMVSPAEGPGLSREVVLGGPERSAALVDLIEDTEYKVEMFGLVLGKRSQSVMERVRTGTYRKDRNEKNQAASFGPDVYSGCRCLC